MRNFLSVNDAPNVPELVAKAAQMKANPFGFEALGRRKTLGLLFFNPSLRTRISTVKAAQNLGMETIVMNVTQDSWQLETEDGAVMDGGKAEHVKEAAAVIGSYCDVLAVRSFPGLVDREEDYQEKILQAFVQYSGKPVINMESATLHPLQSLTDLLTIEEFKKVERAKIVLSWAPHVKPLPQAVSNSFAQWVNHTNHELVIAAPEGMELSTEYAGKAEVLNDQAVALDGAHFVYAKNWSSYQHYGQIADHPDWIIDQTKMNLTQEAFFMHCLPVRRNVVVSDEVMDSDQAIHIQQASNRTWAAQAVLHSILEKL
ncbi:MAG: N-acetylornithine carbamoyltransferase [Cytophagales bacterium]|nr:N-acetylornithine carbamoyltransferase [Cytophagales bacterium]